MPVSITLMDAERRVVLTTSNDARSSQVADVIIRSISERPELRLWDWIQDLRQGCEDASIADVDRLVSVFAAVNQPQAGTVFVTHDRTMSMWARVMDHQFKNRRHWVVATLEAADELLSEYRSGTSARA